MIYWLDQELGSVRAMDESGVIRDLYPAINPRPALALDEGMQRLYWNSEYHEQLEAAVISKPGLFAWVQATEGDRPTVGQRVPVLEDFASQNVEVAQVEKAPDWMPFPRGLVFDPALQSHLSLGPMLVDCRKGLSFEVVFCPREAVPQKAAGADVPSVLLQLGHNGAESMVRLTLDDVSVTLEITVNWVTTRLRASMQDWNRNQNRNLRLQWRHVIVTLDSDGSAKLVNCAPGKDSREVTAMMVVPPEHLWQESLIGCGLFFASDQVSASTLRGDYSGYFHGSIASVRIWNQCLSESFLLPGRPLLSAPGEEPLHHRSLMDAKIGEKWLMSGSLDGSSQPVPLYQLATDHGMVVVTHQAEEKQAQDDLAKARADLLSKQEDQREQLSAKAAELNAKHLQAAADRKEAKENYDAAHTKSSAQITESQAQQAAAKFVNFLKKAAKLISNHKRTSTATSQADQQRTAAHTQAKIDKAAAHDKAYAPVKSAREDLAKAQARAKEKGIKLPPYSDPPP